MSQSAIMQLLEAKVPLSLLLDLADADHVPSRSILRHESADLAWLHGLPTPRQPSLAHEGRDRRGA